MSAPKSLVCFLVLVILSTSTAWAAAPQYIPDKRDYLHPDLRAKIQQLKRDVAREAVTNDTIDERFAIVWDWANAYAIAGGSLPVMLPFDVAISLSFNVGAPRSLRFLVNCDNYVREMQVREENPDAIGPLSISPEGKLPANSWQTLTQTYTVGDLPMRPGGSVLVGRQFMSNQGPLQRDDPAGDNYITIASSNSTAQFENTNHPFAGMHGGFRGAAGMMTFTLRGATLGKGDTITVTYGDKSGGSRGFQVQTFANDFYPLPLYIDFDGKENFFTVPIKPFRVRGIGVHSVHGFAPSVVGVGEPFDVSVRSEDLYYNRAAGAIPAYEVQLNGESHSTIPAGRDAITVLEDLTFDSPGVYRFAFQSPDGKVTGEANPVWVREHPERRIYWGETHGHSGLAEGQGSPEFYFRFAREDAVLDFVTLSEHDLWMDNSEWELLRSTVTKYKKENEFIVYLGYEWTMTPSQGGHHNVFFRRPEGRKRVGVQRAPTLSDLFFKLKQENANVEDVLVIPHCHNIGDWRITDPDVERLVEIMSQHGTFEWFGNRYVERGYQKGFIAASDDHLSHPGYTGTQVQGLFQRGGLAAVNAPSKTTDAIFSGLRARNTYATTGERIILDVSLNGAGMGSRAQWAEKRLLEARAIGTSAIDTITVVKNGEDVWTKDYLTTKRPSNSFVQVNFTSSNEQFFRDNPRGWRYWTGYLDVEGAKLVSFDTPQFRNRYQEFARLDEDNPNRIHFFTGTRGKASAILLELDDITKKARIDIRLEARQERTTGPQAFRQLANIPAARVELPFSDVEDGFLRRDFQVDRYQDHITLRFLDPKASSDRSIRYVDNQPVSRDDYYYVRVKQLDGGLAWSSPIWVGGVTPT